MRIHRRRRGGYQKKKPLVPEYDANTKITAEQLRVISDTGEMLGVISTREAQKIAEERELDLVVVSPKADPPVAKIIDLGQFKYQKEKEARKNKATSKQRETKAIRLSVRIGKHDMEVRMKRAVEFLNRKDKVKLEIVLRGREKAHPELGKEIMEKFVETLQTEHGFEMKIEQPFARQGGRLTMVVGIK